MQTPLTQIKGNEIKNGFLPVTAFILHRWQYDILIACHIFKAYQTTHP